MCNVASPLCHHVLLCAQNILFQCCALSRSVVSHSLQPTRLLCPWGFSGQEYWSGLPCPFPGDLPNPGIEPRSPTLQVASLPSEPPGKPTIILWLCKGESKSHSVVSNPLRLNPMDCSLPGSSVHGILQARILEWVAVPFCRDLPNPGIQPRSPALQADSLSSEPPGNPSIPEHVNKCDVPGNAFTRIRQGQRQEDVLCRRLPQSLS